jgi:hypothetical protein
MMGANGAMKDAVLTEAGMASSQPVPRSIARCARY